MGFPGQNNERLYRVKLNQNAADRFNKALNAGELVDFNDLLEMLDRETRMNGGNHTRSNTEDVLIATKGEPD